LIQTIPHQSKKLTGPSAARIKFFQLLAKLLASNAFLHDFKKEAPFTQWGKHPMANVPTPSILSA
jgi:hypothetical protein